MYLRKITTRLLEGRPRLGRLRNRSPGFGYHLIHFPILPTSGRVHGGSTSAAKGDPRWIGRHESLGGLSSEDCRRCLL